VRALAVVLLCGSTAYADEFAESTAPLPADSYMRVEPSYTITENGSASQLLGRGVLVYRGMLIPGFRADRMVSAFIAEAALEHERSARSDAIGLADVELAHLSGIKLGENVVGMGIAVVLPTATSSAFGGDRFRIGPAWFGQIEVGDFELSLLARTGFAVTGGDRAAALTTRLEPTVTVTLRKGWYLSSDGEIDVTWLADSAVVPVNMEIGYTIGDRVLIQLGPELVVAGAGRGDLKIDFRIDVLDR
jgi:hypothetical protein